MNIIISNSSDSPIYQQIYSQIRDQILSSELHEGEGLPSIRYLALELKVSVITTKRAYDELEKEGLIDSVIGKGCFVRVRSCETLARIMDGELNELANDFIAKGRKLGLSDKDMIGRLEKMLMEHKE